MAGMLDVQIDTMTPEATRNMQVRPPAQSEATTSSIENLYHYRVDPAMVSNIANKAIDDKAAETTLLSGLNDKGKVAAVKNTAADIASGKKQPGFFDGISKALSDPRIASMLGGALGGMAGAAIGGVPMVGGVPGAGLTGGGIGAQLGQAEFVRQEKLKTQAEKDKAAEDKWLKEFNEKKRQFNSQFALANAKLEDAKNTDKLKGVSPITADAIVNSRLAIQEVKTMTKFLDEGKKIAGTKFGKSFGQGREYQASVDQLSDVIGRLRSGGAINEEELKTFNNFIPKKFDSAELKQKKLTKLNTLFGEKLKLLDPTGDVQSVLDTPETKSISMSKNDEAIAWAKSNPNDPRAKKILAKLGV